MTPELSIVVPVYEEEASLDELLERVERTLDGTGRTWELLLVDDGSRDRSRAMIEAAARRRPGTIVGVLLNRNYGQHAAVMAGFRQSRGAIVVTLDADLQNPPEEIPTLLERIDAGCDVVGGVRRDREDSLFRRRASAIVNGFARRATGVAMRDYGCMLRAYRRTVVDAMLRCHERSTFIPVLANTFAREVGEVEVGHAARAAGDSKYSLWKLINLQFDLLTSMTTFPLRLLSIAGVAISIAGVGFGILLAALRLLFGAEWAADGVFTLFAVLFVFVGLQFVGMGLLGEYLGRVYHDVRARPRWFVERVVDGRSDSERREDEPARPVVEIEVAPSAGGAAGGGSDR